MASNQALSAVAQRKAGLLENSAKSNESTRKLPDAVDEAVTPADLPSGVPLKRKTSVVSLKETGAFNKGSKAAKQSRKKSKAERPTHDLESSQQVSVSSIPQRAYSPSQPVVDSSDEDQPPTSPGKPNSSDSGVYIDQEEDPVSHPRARRTLGNIFNPIDKQSLFSLSAEEAFSVTGQPVAARLLVMQPGESLAFVGAMDFVLLQGPAELMGVPLLPSETSHRVFAPRSHPIPALSVPRVQDTVSARGLSGTHGLPHQLPQHIRSLVTPTQSIILVRELPSGVEGLGRIMRPFGGLFEPDARDMEVSYSITKGLHALKAEPQYDPIFYLPRDWELALNDTISNAPKDPDEDAPVILVKGGKNSGKSTFSRTLANRLTNVYRRVAFVECDLGQSEFTPGGMVSLNVLTAPIFERIFEPSHIVDFHVSDTSSNPGVSSLPRKAFEGSLDSARTNSSTKQISLTAIPPPLYPPRFSAADMRSLALMSYFHGRFSQGKSAGYLDSFIEYWDTSLPLKAVAPIIVDPDLALESITIAAPGGDDVVPSELSKALVCGVVGLVAPESTATRTGAVYVQGTSPPSPQTSRCIGLGFIRGVSDTKIQLLTPAPVQELRGCRSFVLGELSMPVWAFLDSDRDNHGENELPYLQWGRSVAESAGGERRRIRRNIMRRSQA
ncbi:Polynucleotide 5'-hydroxyl-kinase grc3 [Ceratobasidium sp. 370]|nr:Polynucleotide 5'-hydroxyl-kinase grc3 [Ceratobasidium sp. 370]